MTTPPEVYFSRLLRQLEAFYRLPGYLFCDSLMAFWGCNRSVVSKRLSRIDELGLAVIRSECHSGRRRWYWIDPYPTTIPDHPCRSTASPSPTPLTCRLALPKPLKSSPT